MVRPTCVIAMLISSYSRPFQDRSRTQCVLAAVLAACITFAACHPASEQVVAEPASAFQNVVGDVAFVGDEACAGCHEDAYLGYQAHGMAQSFYTLTAETAVEDFSGIVVYHEPSGYYYTAYREGDAFVQEEYRLGTRGEKTHRLKRSMDYVVGSGSAARTYLTEEGGRFYELPLTWYTQANSGTGRWDFSPGYAEANGRFDRTIPPRCMACHNGTSEPVPFADGMFRARRRWNRVRAMPWTRRPACRSSPGRSRAC